MSGAFVWVWQSARSVRKNGTVSHQNRRKLSMRTFKKSSGAGRPGGFSLLIRRYSDRGLSCQCRRMVSLQAWCRLNIVIITAGPVSCGDITAVDRGRKRLGETADADDPVQGGKTRRQVRLKCRKGVILNDGQIMRTSQRQQPMRGLQRDRPAGRIVQRGIGDVVARIVIGQRHRESRRIRPRWREQHPHDSRLVNPQRRLEVEIAEIIHRHRIAGAQQITIDRSTDCESELVSKIVSGPISSPSSANGRTRIRRRFSGPRLLPQSVRMASGPRASCRKARRTFATSVGA